MKKRIGLIVIAVVLILGGIYMASRDSNIGKPFEEVVKDAYFDKAMSKEFDKVFITKYLDSGHEEKEISDVDLIEKLLNVFYEYEITEVNDASDRGLYNIVFLNTVTKEELWIHLMTDNYLWVSTSIYTVNENEDKKVIKHEHIVSRVNYQIVNRNFNFDSIDSLIDALN